MSGRGRIAILNGILSGNLPPTESSLAKIFSCIQCRACSENCPPGIDIPEVIYTGRKYLRRYDGSGRSIRFFTRMALKHPDMMFSAARFFKKVVDHYLKKRGLVPSDFDFPENSLKRTPQVITPKNKIGRVAVFKGCSTNYLFPHLGKALVSILFKLGFEIIMPTSEVCCGTPFRTLGMEREAKTFARKNVQIFGRLKVDSVISLCPTCVLALKYEYKNLINVSIKNAIDISSFIAEKFDINLNKSDNRKAFYHDPCHMLYGLKVTDQPRKILKQCGLEPVDTAPHSCCGFGGTYSLKFGKASMKQAADRGAEIEKSSADVVFTSCPGCMLQLRKVLNTVEVFHVVEAIDRALG